jgi:prevent-host-death family protein
MCYVKEMKTVGLRELRQDASELIRQVENGAEIEITVAGRSAARLVPPRVQHWQSWSAIADIFSGRADPDWESDHEQIDQSIEDPWEPKR